MANNQNIFVPTTPLFDVQSLAGKDLSSPEFIQFLVKLTQTINIISIQLNLKTYGAYALTEQINGNTFFPNPNLSSTTAKTPIARQEYDITILFGALPNAGSKSVAHGIVTDTNTTFTYIYATASDTTDMLYLSIPYASTIGNDIQLDVDSTNVTITTTFDYSSFNVVYVFLGYIKQ